MSNVRFVICIDNSECPASLEKRKIYEVVPDGNAAKHGQIRVIDESGEDYLYPEEYSSMPISPKTFWLPFSELPDP